LWLSPTSDWPELPPCPAATRLRKATSQKSHIRII
jgi:hypothetical protein